MSARVFKTSFINWFVICVLMLFALPIARADAIENNQDELQAIQKQIKILQKKIDSDEQALGKERGDLKKIEQEIVEINEQQGKVKAEIEQVRARQQELKARADAERARIAGELSRLGDMVLSQHALGEKTYLKLLLSQQDPGEIERAMVYYKYLAQMTSEQVENGREQVQELLALEEQVAGEQAKLEQLLETRRSQQQRLEQAGKQREQAIASLDNSLTKSANRVGRLKEDENRIRKLVAGLQEAARQREQARAKAAAKAVREQQQAAPKQAKAPESKTTTTVIKPVIQRVSNDGLGQYKGRLSMPVDGAIRAAYGATKPGSGVKWNGIMLNVAEGEPVRSIYDGQVVYADWFRGFGEMVIVDHGQGYMSLYSHNSRLTRTPGEQVKANDIVAYSGSSGGLSEPGLYFEVRYNGEPRDPLLWVKR